MSGKITSVSITPIDINNSGSGASISHFGVKNVIYSHNIIFDAAGSAIVIMGSYDWEVNNNIFADINKINPEDRSNTSTMYLSGDNPNNDDNIK